MAETAVALLDSGRRLLVVHGNGPQVGALAMAQEAVAREVPPQPLFVLGAMTQGQLGYLLSQAIGDALASSRPPARGRGGDDPGRRAPRRPGLRPAHQADRPLLLGGARAPAGRRRAAGTSPRTRAAAGAAWSRRPSRSRWSRPRRSGACSTRARWWWPAAAAACPSRASGDELVGVDAVIDKDFAAALIGGLVGATSLLLLTGVEQVAARLRHAGGAARSTG